MTEVNTRLEVIDDSELESLNTRPGLPRYIRQLWKYRFFTLTDGKSRALQNGRNTYLGKVWVLLDPILQVLVYFLVFGIILKTDRGIDNYISFLVIGVIFFGFFSKGITGCSLVIQSSQKLISSFTFPKATIVIARVLRQFIDNIVPALTAVALAIAFEESPSVHLSIILIVPLFFLIHIAILGFSLIAARVTAFLPDAKALIALLARALFFISGVFFSVERFDTHQTIANLVEFNPIYKFLMIARASVLGTSQAPLSDWFYIVAWSFGLLFLGFLIFWQREDKYATVK